MLLQLLVQYWLNLWNRNFFDALGARDASMLWTQASLFVPLAAASSALGLLSVWGRMTVQRKWRESVTRRLITRWLKNGRYRRLRHIPGEHQQADARIAQDARVATDAPIDLALGLLNSVLGAIVFIGVLWSVGGDLSINVSGRIITVPGYLVIAVITYSGSITITMMVIGRHLTHVIQDLDQAEATFRSAANCLCDDARLDTCSAAMLLGAVAAIFCRPDLARKTWVGAVLFLAYYTLFLLGVEWTAPGYILRVWNVKALSGLTAFGIPLEELLFASAFGAYWSGVYEHFTWKTFPSR